MGRVTPALENVAVTPHRSQSESNRTARSRRFSSTLAIHPTSRPISSKLSTAKRVGRNRAIRLAVS